MRVFGLAGWSGSGKTTLMRQLIPALVDRGHRVSTIKHAHHAFDVDQPGKDSYEHRTAGATEVMIGSAARFALMHELRGAPEPELGELMARMAPVDFILIEGFKRTSHPKLEVYRSVVGKPPLWPSDEAVVAVASDTPIPDCPRPVLALDDIAAIADLVEARAADPAALLR